MVTENEALAGRFQMDVFQAGDLEAADDILSDDFVWHGGLGPGEEERGSEAVKEIATAIIEAFPDRRVTQEDTLSQDDKVLIRWSMTGKQTGELMGITPAGKEVNMTGFDLFRIAGGKIVEMWQEVDQLGMMHQLGVFDGVS